jgi:vancomycin resistance protein VanW
MKAGLVAAIVGIGALGLALSTGAGTSPRLVGRFQTSLEGRTQAQRHNTALSARAINGMTAGPGDILSFNKAVGSWSRDKGFRKAPVSFNGSLIDAWGGGVCQTSTTLYNAALGAGLEVVERSPHRFAPGYVTPGRDAAVAFPSIDLKLRNTLSKPVQVKAIIKGTDLIVELWSAAPKPEVRLQTKVIQQTPVRTKTLGGAGSPSLRSPGKAGWEVQTLRWVGGERELVSHDYYPVMHRVVEWVKDVE